MKKIVTLILMLLTLFHQNLLLACGGQQLDIEPNTYYSVDLICSLKNGNYDNIGIRLYKTKKIYHHDNGSKRTFYSYPFLGTGKYDEGFDDTLYPKFHPFIKKNIFMSADEEGLPVHVDGFIKKNNQIYFIANITPQRLLMDGGTNSAFIELYSYSCINKKYKKEFTIPQTENGQIVTYGKNRAKVLKSDGDQLYYVIRDGVITKNNPFNLEIYSTSLNKKSKHKKIAIEEFKVSSAVKKEILRQKNSKGENALQDLLLDSGYSISSISSMGEKIKIKYMMYDESEKMTLIISLGKKEIESINFE